MKFYFPLESLLRHRKSLEDVAQRNFHEAQSRAQLVLKKIDEMYSLIDLKRSEIYALESQGGTMVNELQTRDEFIEYTYKKIEIEKVKFRELQFEADQKREELTQAMLEYKIVEKLKNNKLQEFRKMKSKKEMKFIDDISVMNSSNKRKREDL